MPILKNAVLFTYIAHPYSSLCLLFWFVYRAAAVWVRVYKGHSYISKYIIANICTVWLFPTCALWDWGLWLSIIIGACLLGDTVSLALSESLVNSKYNNLSRLWCNPQWLTFLGDLLFSILLFNIYVSLHIAYIKTINSELAVPYRHDRMVMHTSTLVNNAYISQHSPMLLLMNFEVDFTGETLLSDI